MPPSRQARTARTPPFRVDPDLLECIRQVADEQDRSMAATMRLLLRLGLDALAGRTD